MKKLILFVAFIYSFTISAQKSKEVYDANPLTFFGYDFTHFKLADVKLIYQGEKIRQTIPLWISFLEKPINERKLSSLFDKDVIFDFTYTYNTIKSINEDSLPCANFHKISPDSIQGIVNNYKLKQSSGVGFVVIMECFEKRNKTCSAYFTFFDIATKKVLRSDHYSYDSGGGHTLRQYWGRGISIAFLKYLKYIYWE